MLSLKRPIDLAAIGFAVALGLLALSQWKASRDFVAGAVSTSGRVTEIRLAKRVLFDAAADGFATVEFSRDVEGTAVLTTAELPTPVHHLGLSADGLVGTDIRILYDPSNPTHVRFNKSRGAEGAAILALLALGALFIPLVLRKSALASVGSG